jgi:uncharacterized protein (DUF1778 family)
MTQVKDSRLAVRLSSDQNALIRRAAEVEGASITEFTVDAAVAHARDVLLDRRLFLVDDDAWAEFLAILDRPVAAKPALENLFARESIFE